MADTPRVSVCVPVRDRRERMLRCLDALLEQDHESYEVLVLDNGSTDGTLEACRARAAETTVPLHVEAIEGTVGRVRNRGAALARGEIVAFTDSDCAPRPDWLSAGARAFADPSVGVATGTTLPEGGPEALRSWAATIHVTGPTARFESCNLFFRREPFVASDGFDETVGHFWEDTAAGWAMRRGGWTVAFAPDAVVVHDVTYPGLGWWLRRARRYGNGAAIVRRYPELRRELLWARWFLRPRSAKLIAALAGVALFPSRPSALGLALPYARERGPRRMTRQSVSDAAGGVLFDLAVLAGMLEGSIRHRSLVL